MNGLRGWAVAVCTVAVVCTALSRLFPETALGRQGRRLIPCVFLCVILAPLLKNASLSPELSPAAGEQSATSAAEVVRRQTAARLNQTLLDVVNQALKEHGLSAKKVDCGMDIDAEGRISMGQITVFVDGDAAVRSAAVRQLVEKRLGTPVLVAQWKEESDGTNR